MSTTDDNEDTEGEFIGVTDSGYGDAISKSKIARRRDGNLTITSSKSQDGGGSRNFISSLPGVRAPPRVTGETTEAASRAHAQGLTAALDVAGTVEGKFLLKHLLSDDNSTYEKLANYTGYTERTVQTKVYTLRDAGLVEVIDDRPAPAVVVVPDQQAAGTMADAVELG